MAPDDRDSLFEKALERHFRASRTGAHPSGDTETSPSHPNAEVLAAYHERLLAPDQMLSFKQHLAGCERCQQILATLEATDDLLLPSDQTSERPQNVVTMPAPHVEIPAEIVSAPIAPGPAVVPSRAARLAQSAWRSKTLRGANWRWLAPAGAIAAMLLLWIAFHESHPSYFELAKNTQPVAAPPPPPATQSVAPSPQTTDSPRRENSPSSVATRSEGGALAKEESRLKSPALLDERKSAEAAKPAAPLRSADAATAAPQSDRDANESDLHAGARAHKRTPQPPPPQAPASAVTDAAPAVHDYAQSQANKKDDAQSAGLIAEVAHSKAEAAKSKIAGQRPTPEQEKQRAAGNVISLESAQNMVSTKERGMLRVAKISAPNVIAAPQSSALWRVAQAGLIEHSTDAGAHWIVQPSGVVADLLTGSALSATVCWIVGRNGAVLRTTDAGAHWQELSPPVTDDLEAVFAVSAQQATVSTATPAKAYRTTDGGKTWTQLTNP